MGSTTLNQLRESWNREREAKTKRMHQAAGKLSNERWKELVLVSCRNIQINRAKLLAWRLMDLQFWHEAVRTNRRLSGMPKQVFVFGNSGKPKGVRDD